MKSTRETKKIIRIFIIMTISIVWLLGKAVFAENTSTTNGTQNTASVAQGNKSNNANLSNLGMNPNDFSGFKESKTEYSVTVPNKIAEVEIYATPKDRKATVKGTGKVKLKEGENVAKVEVTAENGTTKTYTINIKRLKSGEKGDTNNSSSTTKVELTKLEVTGAKLEPNFSKDVHQYIVNMDSSEKDVKIVTETNPANAKVEIIGNDQLINGQNIITILVTDAKETSADTYQIYINKNLVTQEELNKHIEEAEQQYNIKLWIARILIALITICIIALLVIIYKRQNNEEYQESKKEKQKIKEDLKKSKKKDKRKVQKNKIKEKKKKQEAQEEKSGKHKRKH